MSMVLSPDRKALDDAAKAAAATPTVAAASIDGQGDLEPAPAESNRPPPSRTTP